MGAINQFETGDTVQFTWTSSVAPDSAPTLLIRDASSTVASITGTQSNTTNYYALYTTPAVPNYFVAEWVGFKTHVGSAYQVTKRMRFKTVTTNPL